MVVDIGKRKAETGKDEGNKVKRAAAVQTRLFPHLDLITWKTKESCLYGAFNEPSSTYEKLEEGTVKKVAAFDFDGTIACWEQKGGKQPKGPDDWLFFHPSTPKVLEKLHSLGYLLVILSNQKNITLPDKRNLNRLAAFKGRMEKTAKNFMKYCKSTDGIVEVPPFFVIAATLDDFYRKPTTGMWHLLERELRSINSKVQPEISFYVGDAAGRKSGSFNDHSDTDLKFAMNLDIPFYQPEQVFNDQVLDLYQEQSNKEIKVIKAPVEIPPLSFNPRAFLEEREAKKANQEDLDLSLFDVIIFIGSPASGKSTYYSNNLLKSHELVSQDKLGSLKKCLKNFHEHLVADEKVVIDNTNPQKDTRKAYLTHAKAMGKRIAALYFDTPQPVVLHNNIYRSIAHEMQPYFPAAVLDFDPKVVPAVAINTFRSKMEIPSADEGFDAIFTIEFMPRFDNDHVKRMWTQILY